MVPRKLISIVFFACSKLYCCSKSRLTPALLTSTDTSGTCFFTSAPNARMLSLFEMSSWAYRTFWLPCCVFSARSSPLRDVASNWRGPTSGRARMVSQMARPMPLFCSASWCQKELIWAIFERSVHVSTALSGMDSQHRSRWWHEDEACRRCGQMLLRRESWSSSLLSGSVAAEVKARQVLATRHMFRYVPEVYM